MKENPNYNSLAWAYRFLEREEQKAEDPESSYIV